MPLLKSYFILINYQNNQKNSRGVQGHTPKDGTGTYPRDHMLTGLGVFSLVLRLKKKKKPKETKGVWGRQWPAISSKYLVQMFICGLQTHPSGCCRTETISSTARAPAITARPGRLTVHCWSRVRSLVD